VSGTFAASTVYTATITLNPQVGYTLTGVAENSFTVAGAITTNGANSGVVTAEYIITAALVSPNIGNIMAITGGTFNNGITNMTVSSFRMSQYEITGEQYAAVMGIADPSYFSDITNNPVEQVNWYDALVFCNTLSMAESLIPVYTINGSTDPVNWGVVPTSSINAMWDAVIANWGASGYRLPTETEWEFAARGGNSTHSYTYAGSNIINEVAWYIDNSNNTIHAVGELSANELGFFDMSGNVWELCWDWSDAYPVAAQMDYRGATSGTYRVARGGCGAQNASFCAVVFRGDGYQYDRNPAVGFRVVRP
jgi:formylglycine-generating enzyme required for sulfatase activity